MDQIKRGPHERLKEQWSRCLRDGGAGELVLASSTLEVAEPAAAVHPSCPPTNLAGRAAKVRRQASAQAAEWSSADGEAPFAWGNWGNWHNGWPNGWRNWHNWRNWW
jgi:hypothetical protein